MATVMAMVMMVAMTVMPVSADTVFNNLTLGDNTSYTNQISDSYTSLNVMKIANDWYTTDYFTLTEANSVTWTWPNGGASNFVIDTNVKATERSANTGEYFATLRIKAAEGANTGAYSVRANWMYDTEEELTATMDLTLVITGSNESASVKVYIDGLNDDLDDNTFTVTNGAVSANAGTYGYATPVSALAKMKAVGDIAAYSPENGDYINTITESGTITKTASGWYGWQYRVYKASGSTYTIEPTSLLLSPSALKLTDGDVIIWYYGPYDSNTDAHFLSYCNSISSIFGN